MKFKLYAVGTLVFTSVLTLHAQEKPVVKPYAQVITSQTKTSKGLFNVHYVAGRYYFELPDLLLGRDILVVNRIAKSSVGKREDMLGLAGDMISEKVIRFERAPQDKIFMEQISYDERSADSSSNGMYTAVKNSNLQPVIAGFPVKAYHIDSISKVKSTLIDLTDYLNNDNEIFYFSSIAKKTLQINGLQADRSYIKEIKAYPENIEIKALRTYGRTAYGASNADITQIATYELNSSIVLLPEIPMKPRYADPRIGYFSTGYTDFDANPQGVKKITMVTRWRMEPKAGEEENYKKGILVEPKKQIVFYIDPATPKKWVPYLIAGVNEWQKAFEQAGFKNAILGKEAPADSTWSIDDARHNAIVYKPSAIVNAFGLHVHDPRSGEILESHINLHHNIMKILQSWYMLQAGAVDSKARKMVFDDALMGQLLKYIASHEVGHTLGLTHNFGSSSTVPVESLRDKKFLEKNGHTPSIMDYARFNYVAQPEDGLSEKDLFPRIGDYDRWAIEWGYRWMPDAKTADDETAPLNKLTILKLKNNRLWYASETDSTNPKVQSEDLGDDAVLASTYGIKNLKRILPELSKWTKTPNEDYDNLEMMYGDLVKQFTTYMIHVSRNIGGVYHDPKTAEQEGPVHADVPYQKQKAAMDFLNRELFTTPTWLFDPEVKAKTNVDFVNLIRNTQSVVLKRLLSPNLIPKLVQMASTVSEKNYTIFDLFDDLKTGIWAELYNQQDADLYKRTLQKLYVEQILVLMNTKDPAQTDICSLARAHLTQLKTDIDKATPPAQGLNLAHLQYLSDQIEKELKK